jgi:hypothetical protein
VGEEPWLTPVCAALAFAAAKPEAAGTGTMTLPAGSGKIKIRFVVFVPQKSGGNHGPGNVVCVHSWLNNLQKWGKPIKHHLASRHAVPVLT